MSNKLTISKKYVSGTIIILPASETVINELVMRINFINSEGNIPTATVFINDIEYPDNVIISLENSVVDVRLPHKLFSLGSSTVKVKITDSLAEGEETATYTEWSYPVTAENRNVTTIIRSFTAEGDYLLSDKAYIDPDRGVVVKNNAEAQKGLLINKYAIDMNGHNKIKQIIVNTEDDKTGQIKVNLDPIARDNYGQYMCETYSLMDLKNYSNVTGIKIVEK